MWQHPRSAQCEQRERTLQQYLLSSSGVVVAVSSSTHHPVTVPLCFPHIHMPLTHAPPRIPHSNARASSNFNAVLGGNLSTPYVCSMLEQASRSEPESMLAAPRAICVRRRGDRGIQTKHKIRHGPSYIHKRSDQSETNSNSITQNTPTGNDAQLDP